MAFTSFASFNKERLFNIDTADFDYVKLKDLFEANGPDEIYPIRGIYVGGKSEYYEETPILATDSFYVNLPQHQLIDIKDMLNSRQAINCINNGGAGFTIEKYIKKLKSGAKKECYKAHWVDMESGDIVD